jgi:hypothetical protein
LLNKFHNIVVYIRTTPQRREEFLTKARKQLKILKSTREAAEQLSEDFKIKNPFISV